MLTCDEDRERKAEHKVPGTYHIVVIPASFSGLEPYRDIHDDVGSSTTARSQTGEWRSPALSPDLRQDIFQDPDTLILGSFEENVRKTPALGLLTARFNPSRSPSSTSNASSANYVHSANAQRPSNEASPMLDTLWEFDEDHRIKSFYKSFVRNQLDQVHWDSLGTSTLSGRRTIPEVLDEQAPHYNPVSTIPESL